MLIVADIAVAPVSIISGLSMVLIFLPVLVCEAIVLRLLHWGSLGRSTLDAFLMNIVSTVIGWLLLLFAFNLSSGTALLLFVVAWILSVLTEGGVLLLLRRHGVRETWRAALIANTASYLLLVALVAGLVWSSA